MRFSASKFAAAAEYAPPPPPPIEEGVGGPLACAAPYGGWCPSAPELGESGRPPTVCECVGVGWALDPLLGPPRGGPAVGPLASGFLRAAIVFHEEEMCCEREVARGYVDT